MKKMFFYSFLWFPVLAVLLSGCSEPETGSIGNSIAEPFFVKALEDSFVVVNSNVTGKYQSGSIQIINSEGNLAGVHEIESRATAVAYSDSFMSIAFSGEKPYIDIYLRGTNNFPNGDRLDRVYLNDFSGLIFDEDSWPRVSDMHIERLEGSDDELLLVAQLTDRTTWPGVIFLKLNTEGRVVRRWHAPLNLEQGREDLHPVPLYLRNFVSLGRNHFLLLVGEFGLDDEDLRNNKKKDSAKPKESKPIFLGSSFFASPKNWVTLNGVQGQTALWVDNDELVKNNSLGDLYVFDSKQNMIQRLAGLEGPESSLNLSQDGQAQESSFQLNESASFPQKEGVLDNIFHVDFLASDKVVWVSSGKKKRGNLGAEDVGVYLWNPQHNPENPLVFKFQNPGSLAVGVNRKSQLILGASYSMNTLELLKVSDGKIVSVKTW